MEVDSDQPAYYLLLSTPNSKNVGAILHFLVHIITIYGTVIPIPVQSNNVMYIDILEPGRNTESVERIEKILNTNF